MLLSLNLILYLVCIKYNNTTLFIGWYPIALKSYLTSWLTNISFIFTYQYLSRKEDLALKGLAFQTVGMTVENWIEEPMSPPH